MSRKMSIIAFTLGLAVTLPASVGLGVAIARVGEPNMLSDSLYPIVELEKTDRITQPPETETEAAGGDEQATVEWVIDCYDQYGPDAASPDAGALAACMPS